MKPLSRLESLIGEMLERPAWLLSSRRLHPLALNAALSRELERRALRLSDRVLAPDDYTLVVHPDDLASFEDAVPALERELGTSLAREVAERDLTMNRPPVVRLRADSAARPGRVQVRSTFSAAKSEAAPPPADVTVALVPRDLVAPATTLRVVEVPGAVGSPALQVLDAAGRVVQTVSLRRLPAIIGRGSECEVPLLDAKVSRAHARIERSGNGLLLNDLGSLNGTLLNGERLIGRSVLADGDLIQIGRIRLRFAGGSNPDA